MATRVDESLRNRAFEVVQSICMPGGRSPHLNEDLIGWTDDAAWVLDGASGLRSSSVLGTPSDARWFVHHIDQALKAQLRSDQDLSQHSQQIIRAAIESVCDSFERQVVRKHIAPDEIPSASMSFLRARARTLDCALLGDCRLLFVGKNSGFLNIVGSAALGELDERAIRMWQRTQHLPSLLAEPLWNVWGQRLLRRNRARMNHEGGYWSLSLDTAAADQMENRSIATNAGDCALLVSDGFYRLVDTFHVFTDVDLVRAALKDGLERLYEQLRTLEAHDDSCRQFPRLKRSDDASALLIVFH